MKRFFKILQKFRLVLVINLCFVLLVGVLLFFWSKDDSQEPKKQVLRVEIVGGVKKPGVYNVEKGKIIEDVVKMAGGFSEETDKEKVTTSINRAEIVSDGQKIIIPEIVKHQDISTAQVAGETTTRTTSTSNPATQSQKVNINTASISDLDTLPGIGPAYAQRIIDYRNSNNGFKNLEEIKNIKGIGDKTFEKIKQFISL